MKKYNSIQLVSMISTAVALIASVVMILCVIFMDKEGAGITNAQFTPIRIAMFAAGIPSLVKFYISSKDTREGKLFLLIHGLCLLMWFIFLVTAIISPYFTNIRTSVITSNILVAIGLYVEWAMVNKKWVE